MTTSTKRQWIKRCQHLDGYHKTQQLRLMREQLKRRFRRKGKRGLHLEIMAKPAVWFD